jgi:hypothetical protein
VAHAGSAQVPPKLRWASDWASSGFHLGPTGFGCEMYQADPGPLRQRRSPADIRGPAPAPRTTGAPVPPWAPLGTRRDVIEGGGAAPGGTTVEPPEIHRRLGGTWVPAGSGPDPLASRAPVPLDSSRVSLDLRPVAARACVRASPTGRKGAVGRSVGGPRAAARRGGHGAARDAIPDRMGVRVGKVEAAQPGALHSPGRLLATRRRRRRRRGGRNERSVWAAEGERSESGRWPR